MSELLYPRDGVYTMSMVGKKIISKRTHTHTHQDVSTYIHSSAMALIKSSPGDGTSSLPCCIIKHTLCALRPAGGSPSLAWTWELPSLKDLAPKVETHGLLVP